MLDDKAGEQREQFTQFLRCKFSEQMYRNIFFFFENPLLLAYTQEKDSILSMYGIILYRLLVCNTCNLP